jgi:hypothetical protein
MKGKGKEVLGVFLQYYLRHFYKFHLFLPDISFLFLSLDLDPGKVGMGRDQRALCKQVIHSLNPLTPQIISSLSPLTFFISHIHSLLWPLPQIHSSLALSVTRIGHWEGRDWREWRGFCTGSETGMWGRHVYVWMWCDPTTTVAGLAF